MPAAAETGLALKVPKWSIFVRPARPRGLEVEEVHDVPPPGDGAPGKAAGENLRQGAEVGHDPERLLGAARRDPETGHDLVEDQQRAVASRFLPQEGHEAVRERNPAEAGARGLDDRAGNVRVRREGLPEARARRRRAG